MWLRYASATKKTTSESARLTRIAPTGTSSEKNKRSHGASAKNVTRMTKSAVVEAFCRTIDAQHTRVRSARGQLHDDDLDAGVEDEADVAGVDLHVAVCAGLAFEGIPVDGTHDVVEVGAARGEGHAHVDDRAQILGDARRAFSREARLRSRAAGHEHAGL